MNEKQEFAIACIILVIAIIAIPVGISVLTHGSEPHRIIEGEPIAKAVKEAGLSICSETDTTWNIPGNTGGKVYTISDNCENPSNTVRVESYSFDSAASRDAAIKAYHSNKIGKARPHGNMIVLGQYLIFVDHSGSSLFSRIAEKLKGI